jgi:hypothetical protein
VECAVKEITTAKFTYAELEEEETHLRKRQGWSEKLYKLDFYGAPLARLGARLRQPADGCLVGDDPQPAAAVHGHHARRQRAGGRADRRLAEATALIVKVFSGALSDYLGKRKGWRSSAMRWGR